MKKAAVLFVLLIAALAARHYVGSAGPAVIGEFTDTHATAERRPPAASGREEDYRAGQTLTGAGIVTRVLADDDEGSRHQRFILRLPSGRTLLVAHNVDLAPRVEGLRPGDGVEFSGEYEPSAQGGVLHWTHRDPRGRHAAGWLRHAGRTYQ